ncbi:MAG: hypothetical protein ACUVRS_08110 [Armatimonadota bacterium]
MRYSLMVLAVLLSANCGWSAPDKPTGNKAGSKIGIHLIARYTEGAKKIINANCSVIKILDTTPEMLTALSDFKRRHPDGVAVLRIYTPVKYDLGQDPEACASDYWKNWLYPSLRHLTDEQKKFINYLEGPNEGDNTPCWGSLRDVEWFCRFWLKLGKIMSENGFKPCMGSLPVGSPPGTPSEIEAKIKAFIPALRLAKRLGGCWSYHAYTLKYTKDPEIETWYSLRYRQFYRIFKQYAPDLVDLPLVLTEGGVDNDYNVNPRPEKPGWKRDLADKYKDWLKWFDSEIKRDPYVIGITLFEIGHPEHWDSFDLEPIADWLADYLNKAS